MVPLAAQGAADAGLAWLVLKTERKRNVLG